MKIAAISVKSELKSITNSAHVYPATFADTGHNLVGLNKADGSFKAVEIDSVGSFANRMESELKNAISDILPDITTTISGRTLSIMELPHRIYDAILRDSTLDATPWRKSEVGNKILTSNPQNATALYTYAPLTLLLGGWDSHGGDAGNGVKITRSVACEIWGYDGVISKHCTQRIDPLDITSNAQKHLMVDGVLTLAPDQKAKEGKKPSELGHGDVPSKADKGVFVDRIELSGAISLTRLNRYQFPDDNGDTSPERNAAAVNVLTEIAKLGISLVLDNLDLRSGCELYSENRQFDIIYANGNRESIDVCSSTEHLKTAISLAEEHGLKFNDKPLQLMAGKALADLVARGGDL